MAEPVPQTPGAAEFRARVGSERWSFLVEQALERAEIVEQVAARVEQAGAGRRQSLRDVAPEVGWSKYLHWRRRHESRDGPGWERLLDERLPPPPVRIGDDIRLAACMLRRQDRSLNADGARTHLVAQFGEAGHVSDSSLRRIWSAAGLTHIAPEQTGQTIGESVTHYNGGGGPALLGAADVELGASEELAKAIQQVGGEHAEQQGAVESRLSQPDERDEGGRFTARYNHQWRQGVDPGQADGRWACDADKRRHRDLSSLATLEHGAQTLADRLLAMGVMPLLTERRGFVGLEGPAGAWLQVMGITAYMPASLDKTLAELGLPDVSEAAWAAHARQWHEVSQKWSAPGPHWLRLAAYVDATRDPYWTRHYALSGKVSRVGRVMPCLTRVAVTSGPGVPLVVETYAGTVSLKKRLLPLLDRLDRELGEGQVGRVTIVDSEMATAGLMWALHDDKERIFITVLKGQVLKGAEIEVTEQWEPYRDRDQLREVEVSLDGQGAPKGGIAVRGVQMARPDSRRPKSTVFVTNGIPEALTTSDVATAYLSRWPHQEQVFRDARNGAGLNRSHGYGGEHVTHVALQTKLEQAQARAPRKQAALAEAEAARDEVDKALGSRRDEPSRKAVARAGQEVRRKDKALDKARTELERQRTMPREIYARDTGRDSVMTCLKFMALMLLEFVLKEYFGGAKMQWRTFIEQFMFLPVTERRSSHRCLYQIHENPRQPEMMTQLRAACEEVTRRRLRRDGRLLAFEVVAAPDRGS